MAIEVKEKDIVVPGQVLARGLEYLPGHDVVRDGEELVATRIGLVGISNRLVKIIPLAGKYLPKVRDSVIGKVTSVGFSGWRVDFGWAFEANISLKDGTSDFVERGADLTRYYKPGDYIMAQIVNVAGSKIIDLSMKGPGLRRLGPGRIIQIGSAKVPRVIGKGGSMISMIKEHTGCRVCVGQNGLVWLSADDPDMERLAVDAIRKIELESHISGLTERMKEFLEKNSKGVKHDIQETGKEE